MGGNVIMSWPSWRSLSPSCAPNRPLELSGLPTVQALKEWLLQSSVDSNCPVMPAFWLTWSWSTKETSFCLCGQKFFLKQQTDLGNRSPQSLPQLAPEVQFWVLEILHKLSNCKKKLSYRTSQEVVTAEKSQAGLPGQRNQPVHKTRLIIELNVSSLSGWSLKGKLT